MKKTAILTVILCVGMATMLFTSCFGRDDVADNSKSANNIPQSQSENVSSMIDDMPNSESTNSMQNGDSNSGSVSQSNNNSESDSMNNSSSITNSDTSGSLSSSASQSLPASTYFEEWNMILVNAQNPLKEGFAVEMRPIEGYDNRLFDERAADALEAMLGAAKQAGLELYLVSAYRTPERQATLYENKVQSFIKEGFMRSEAEKQAAMWVARPYTSEHNLGLAADLTSKDWYKENDDLTQEFEKTEHYDWLLENCADYGFILRYQKGKEGITGVAFEPWHYRYVGKQAASIIMQNNLTLEEFLQMKN